MHPATSREHALYIDYRNTRLQFLDTFFELVDWDQVNERLIR